MLESIKQIWRSLKRFFRQLFSGSGSSLRGTKNVAVAVQPLTDTDCEFLFSQLLEGVSHGWHQGRVLKFFERLETRIKQREWLEWLDRFGKRALDSSAPNHQLAARMMRLGEIAQSIPTITAIGDLAYNIGRQIFTRDSDGEVWEYQGADIEEMLAIPEMKESSDNSAGEALTLDQLLELLQQNPAVAQQMSEQLGLNTSDPQQLIDGLLAQLQESQVQEQENAANIDHWFTLGLQQLNEGKLEEAIASWDQALAINPNMTKIWYNRANALCHLYRWDEALASYDQAVNLDAKDYLIWNGLANVFYNTQRIQESLDCWDKVIELNPDYYQAWYDRGYVLEILNRHTEAIKSYHKAIELKPDFPEVLARLKELQPEQET